MSSPWRKHWPAILLLGVLPLCAGLSCAALLCWTLPYAPRVVIRQPGDCIYLGSLNDGAILTAAGMAPNNEEFQGPLRVWDANTGKLRREFLDAGTLFHSYDLSTDDSMLAIHEFSRRSITIFDTVTGEVQRTIHTDVTGLSTWLQFSSSQHELVQMAVEGRLLKRHCWSIATGEHRIESDQQLHFDRVMSADGKWFVQKVSALDGAKTPSDGIILHSAESGEAVASFAGVAGVPQSMTFSPDSRYFCATLESSSGKGEDGSTLIVWDVATRGIVARFHDLATWSFVPEQTMLMLGRSGSDRLHMNLQFWELSRGAEFARIEDVSFEVMFPCLAAENSVLVSADRVVAQNPFLAMIGELIGNAGLGRLAVTEIRFQDVPSDRKIATIPKRAEATSRLMLRPLADGRTVAIAFLSPAGTSDEIALYDLPPHRSWFRIVGWSALLAASVFVACKRLLVKWRGAESAA